MCKTLLVFHWNYVCIPYRFWDIQRQRMVIGNSAVRYITYDFLLVGHSKYSCMLYHIQVIWRWIIVILKRLLKIIQTGTIRKLGCGFLFAFHTMAVSLFIYQIFGVRVYRDLENWVRGCSRSLKTAPFDRPYTTFYWSVTVNIALSCTVFELFDVENIVTLKSGLEVTRGHSNRLHSKAWVRFSIRLS